MSRGQGKPFTKKGHQAALKATKYVVDDSGRKWAAPREARRLLDIPYATLRRYWKSCKFLNSRGLQHRRFQGVCGRSIMYTLVTGPDSVDAVAGARTALQSRPEYPGLVCFGDAAREIGVSPAALRRMQAKAGVAGQSIKKSAKSKDGLDRGRAYLTREFVNACKERKKSAGPAALMPVAELVKGLAAVEPNITRRDVQHLFRAGLLRPVAGEALTHARPRGANGAGLCYCRKATLVDRQAGLKLIEAVRTVGDLSPRPGRPGRPPGRLRLVAEAVITKNGDAPCPTPPPPVPANGTPAAAQAEPMRSAASHGRGRVGGIDPWPVYIVQPPDSPIPVQVSGRSPAGETAPPTVWSHGGRSYSAAGRTPVVVTREEGSVLAAFAEARSALDTAALESHVGNVARVMKQLASKFPGAVATPRSGGRSKGDGYFISVAPAPNRSPQ